MKIVISEQQLKRIISEQSSQQLISDKGYNAILSFENTKGTPNGDNTGATSMNYIKGDERQKETNIRNHINVTIGLKRWFKIPDLFRTQIYSFMFNSDSKDKDLFRWLSGLAQSIDNTINRGNITGKDINDPNVQNSINLINKTIDDGNINNYYNQYIKVLDNQYQSIMNSNTDTDAKGNKIVKPWFKAAYTYSWSVRPQEIENYYNTSDNTKTKPQEPVKKDVPVKSDTPVKSEPKKTTDVVKKVETPVSTSTGSIVVNSVDISHFLSDIREKTTNKKLDLENIQIDVDKFKLVVNQSDTGESVDKLVLALSLSGKPCESCVNILKKNNTTLVKEGTFEGGKRIYNLIALFPEE
jgi:hypothetical protein